MITCAEAVERLWDFLENEVDPEDRDQVEEHLAFCRTCCGELRFAEELRSLLNSRTRMELPGDVAERLAAFVEGLEGAES